MTNVTKYRQLRQATFRLLNKVKASGGFIIYVGIEKERRVDGHDSKRLYHSVLREVIKCIDQECEQRDAKFMLILDQQEKTFSVVKLLKLHLLQCLVMMLVIA